MQGSDIEEKVQGKYVYYTKINNHINSFYHYVIIISFCSTSLYKFVMSCHGILGCSTLLFNIVQLFPSVWTLLCVTADEQIELHTRETVCKMIWRR